MEDFCLCVAGFEDQSLKESQLSDISVEEVTDHRIINGELRLTAGNQTKIKMNDYDPGVVKNTLANLKTFFTKTFLKNRFYLGFSFTSDCDKNQNNLNYSCHSTDTLDKENILDLVSPIENNASVFGSPMKLQSIADIQLNETNSDVSTIVDDNSFAQLKGLPINEARKILSRFCQIQIKKIEQADSILLKNILIICDGIDLNKTLFLGAYHEMRRLTTFRVTFHSKKINLSFLEPINNLSGGNVCTMKSSFDLLSQKDGCRLLTMEAHWTDNYGSSVIANVHAARFVLHVAAPFDYRGSSMYGYYSQLKHVIMLCNGLKDGEFPNVLSTNSFNALENLEKLLGDIKSGVVQESSSPKCGKGKKINLRPVASSDFTDHMWDIFSQCETYQELVMCLKTVFHVLEKNEFPLFVQGDNETMLGGIIRQSSKGLIYFPPLNGLMPLKIVAELGLEKLKKLYSSIVLENDLCSPSDLDGFFRKCMKDEIKPSSISAFEQNYQISNWKLETIKKLHHCIDIMCVIDLHTDNLNLKEAANYVLNHLGGINDLAESNHFVIPLNTGQAMQEVQKLSPTMVRREYKIKEENRVDCFLSTIPQYLSQPIHVQSDTGDITVNFGDLAECYQFRTEEKVLVQ